MLFPTSYNFKTKLNVTGAFLLAPASRAGENAHAAPFVYCYHIIVAVDTVVVFVVCHFKAQKAAAATAVAHCCLGSAQLI